MSRLSGAAAIAFLFVAPPLYPAGPDPFSERVFLENINSQRAARGLPRLELDPNLSNFARKRADEVLAAEGGEPATVVGEALHQRARGSGYDARFLAELVVEAEDSDLSGVQAAWAEGNTGRPMILRDDIRDLGIGIGRRDKLRVYVFYFGLSAHESFARRTAALADRAALTREMIARVNQERQKARLQPLLVNPRLDSAAQRHAEDMLKRSFYGHENPDGQGPLQRALAAGYRPLSVGENIARGEFTLAEVMEGWMASEPHRRDLLDPNYREVGFGFSHGKNANGYQVFWVQVFGRER